MTKVGDLQEHLHTIIGIYYWHLFSFFNTIHLSVLRSLELELATDCFLSSEIFLFVRRLGTRQRRLQLRQEYFLRSSSTHSGSVPSKSIFRTCILLSRIFIYAFQKQRNQLRRPKKFFWSAFKIINHILIYQMPSRI